jgi:hypothetical protein
MPVKLSPLGKITHKDVLAVRGGNVRSASRELRRIADTVQRTPTWRDLAKAVGLGLDELAAFLRTGKLQGVTFNCA